MSDWDKTDESFIYVPGEPFGKNVQGDDVPVSERFVTTESVVEDDADEPEPEDEPDRPEPEEPTDADALNAPLTDSLPAEEGDETSPEVDEVPAQEETTTADSQPTDQ